MTIPNVTISWCRKKAYCKWCEQTIDIGTPILKVFFWNKGSDDNRSWNGQNCYHFPECYSAQGMDYLNRNPFVPHIRGVKRKLSEEDSKQRIILLRRFHSLEQRKAKLTTVYPDNLLMEARIIKQQVRIMLEIANLGGIPKSWATRIG